MSPQKILNLILVAVILVIGANFVYAIDFSEPTGVPPTNNTPAPLNVSDSNQTKSGVLTLVSGLITATGQGVQNGLIVTNGNVGIGDTTPDIGTGGQLKVDVEGNVGATKYCDALGNNCFTSTEMGGAPASPTGTGNYYLKNYTSTVGNTGTVVMTCTAGDVAIGYGALDDGDWQTAYYSNVNAAGNPEGMTVKFPEVNNKYQLLCLDK